jgi:hypothetical protein
MDSDLVEEYKAQILPILPLAKRAFGSRKQNTPAHEASREYTRLLCEFYEKGGSLPKLAKALDVAYPGIRRRVIMENVFVSDIKPLEKASRLEIPLAVERIKFAKKEYGVESYHKQIAEEYKNGFSLQDLAKGLGLTSAAPLYYGAQRSLKKNR